MITLSNGVEISEDTVISALKKAGINVEPKYIFRQGDVAQVFGGLSSHGWRLIVSISGKLYSINQLGAKQGDGTQEYFENNSYKYVDTQQNLLENKNGNR